MTGITNTWDKTAQILSRGDRWKLVTPSDTEDLPAGRPRAFVVTETEGVVVIQDVEGNVMNYPVSAARIGIECPYGPVRILATGTTATGIFAIY